MTAWYENDAFWKVSYDYMFPAAGFELARQQIDPLLKLAGGNVATVLDLCCGPGRFTIPLAERGLALTGVDRCAWLLEKARQAATAEIEWVQTDMRSFVREASFDLVLSLFTSFGYFDSPEENARVLANVHTSLKPGGRFIIETVGKERIAAIFSETSVDELEDGRMRVQRRTVVDDWRRLSNQWLFLEDGKYQSFDLIHFVYSGQELRKLILATGFSSVNLYGSLEGARYDRNASRLVAVAVK